MTLNPQFTALEGFDTASVPAAVGGGGGFGGGGPGGGGGGAGGAAGGLRNVVPGPTFVAGMDGFATPAQGAYGPFGGGPGMTTPTASLEASAILSGGARYSDASAFGNPVPPRKPAARGKPIRRAPKRPVSHSH
jgi:hypothetical protein